MTCSNCRGTGFCERTEKVKHGSATDVFPCECRKKANCRCGEKVLADGQVYVCTDCSEHAKSGGSAEKIAPGGDMSLRCQSDDVVVSPLQNEQRAKESTTYNFPRCDGCEHWVGDDDPKYSNWGECGRVSGDDAKVETLQGWMWVRRDFGCVQFEAKG